ncbi:MAG TPA: ubiquinol-cytochrome c reductase iron-sulfur subunit [Deltaproteobacteria bacterium]|nr:ubiquinol-cytochrome c reductase iron-sulfur subunit [Deltaproteobacteria bacterium]
MKVINDNTTRRKFLSTAFMGFGLVFGLGTLMVRFVQFLVPEARKKRSSEILIGRVSDFDEGGVSNLEVSNRMIALVRTGGGFTAFSRRCTDLGCLVSWDQGRKQFVCPCHQGVYDADGEVVSGPPPRPLDRYDVKVDGDYIYINIMEA